METSMDYLELAPDRSFNLHEWLFEEEQNQGNDGLLLSDTDEYQSEDDRNVEEKFLSSGEVAQKVLDDLEQLEPLSSWTESRMDLTVFDELQALSPAASDLDEELVISRGTVPQNLHTTVASSEYLLQQFEALLASQQQVQKEVEIVLTPPTSPKNETTDISEYLTIETTVEEQPKVVKLAAPHVIYLPETIEEKVIVCEVLPSEEEITTIDAMWLSNSDSSDGPMSTSSSSSEWEPDSPVSAIQSAVKQRPKPYSRRQGGTDDRRVRKKEQNKNAATRYRIKKKVEIDTLLSEENEVEEKNKQLKEKVDALHWELKYLKNLLRDICQAKKA